VKFVQAQGVELNCSEKIGPAKSFSHGGKITLLCGMQPRSSHPWCMRSPIYVAQRFMWRSPADARRDAMFGSAKRHIT
jgi:hypothetical protein